ncbi:MAG: molecular chaperone [Gemmatimonadota bacterium]
MSATAPTGSGARLEEALARSSVYRLLSEVALYPGAGDGGPIAEREDRRAEVEAACQILSEAGYAAEVLGPLAELGSLFLAAQSELVGAEYVRVFGHTVSKVCPPYEAQYGSPHIFEQTNTLADLAGFYRAFGLRVREGGGERLDHVGIELEFMHFLAFKEAYALECHGPDRAASCREAQQKFVRDHLGTWLDDFAVRLVRQAGSGPLRLYGEVLRAFAAAELVYLAVTPTRRKTLEPPPAFTGSLPCGASCAPIPRALGGREAS